MPVAEQTARPWADVVAEFDAVFAPVLDGTAPASALDTERYTLGGGLVGLLPEAGLVRLGSTKGVHRVRHSDGEFALSVNGRTVTARTADGTSEEIELRADVTWEDLAEWLWRLPSLIITTMTLVLVERRKNCPMSADAECPSRIALTGLVAQRDGRARQRRAVRC